MQLSDHKKLDRKLFLLLAGFLRFFLAGLMEHPFKLVVEISIEDDLFRRFLGFCVLFHFTAFALEIGKISSTKRIADTRYI